jgi:glycosyltransferase involved in cell wall biosynthesis
MHIHWIANCVVPPPHSLGGGDRIMVECLRRWWRDHRITVYGWEGTRQLFDYQNLRDVEHVLWPSAQFQRAGFPALFAAQTIVGCRQARRLKLPEQNRNIIVSSSDFPPDSLAALAIKRRYPRVPWVAAFYLFSPKMRDVIAGKPGPGLRFAAYRPLQQFILRRLLRRADLILATGEEDRERLIALGRAPQSVFAVRGGVDLSIPRSVPEPAKKIYDAVFIGRFHPQKGVRELLRIWQLVRQQRPSARLAMIGIGPLADELQQLRHALQLDDAVEFLGFRDGVEKYKIVKASRIVVHPAVYDSGGMAPAEALACGLPGVAFDLPSLRTYYPKGFLKAELGDLPGFAAHLLRLLSDETLYRAMSVEAEAVGREWDWDIRAAELLAAIEKVVV